VEDNPINQNLAVRLLGKQGHEIVLADNGQEALTALEQGTFDLALMDLQMPVMDGLEATAAIRAREKERGGYGPEGRRLPILAMTAFAMAGDREKCFEVGMDGYISKPVRARELFEAIDRISTATEPTNSSPLSTVDSNGIDWSSALEYVAGDEDMLRDLIGIFLTEAPRWMTELQQAIAAGNNVDVKRLAHNLKGSVRIFGAKSAFDSAFSLEQMSRSGNLSGAEEAYAALAQGIDRLTPALMDKRNAEG
jgi:CheY-like chemotaxis protein